MVKLRTPVRYKVRTSDKEMLSGKATEKVPPLIGTVSRYNISAFSGFY